MRYLILLILGISQCLMVSCSQQYINSSKIDAYEYPIKGGTEKWNELSSLDEQLNIMSQGTVP